VETQLIRYLQQRLEGAQDLSISNLFRIPGGASRETWMFDAAWQRAGAPETASLVVRKDPPASLVES
jgi:hypothetical protein